MGTTRGSILIAVALITAPGCSAPDRGQGSPADSASAESVSAAQRPPSAAAAHASVPGTVAFKALGTEPFWALELTSHGMRFSTPEDTAGIRFPSIEPTTAGDTLRWTGETERTRIDVRIWPEQCSDGMSDRTWTHAAVVQVDTTTYRGCADPAPGLTAGQRPFGEWRIVDHRIPGVSALSSEEAAAMHGRSFSLAADVATSGTATCSNPRYRYRTERADSVFRSYNTTVEALDLGGSVDEFIGVTDVMCADTNWPALGSLLLWTADGRPFTVHDGVFFELRRAGPARSPQGRTNPHLPS